VGFLLEIILGYVGEVAIQLIIEILIELGFESIAHSLKPVRKSNKFFSLTGCVLLGGIVGFISVMIFSHRLIPLLAIPGFSMIGPPLLSGLVMNQVGKERLAKGKEISALATFAGGTLFAFGFAVIRYICLAP